MTTSTASAGARALRMLARRLQAGDHVSSGTRLDGVGASPLRASLAAGSAGRPGSATTGRRRANQSSAVGSEQFCRRNARAWRAFALKVPVPLAELWCGHGKFAMRRKHVCAYVGRDDVRRGQQRRKECVWLMPSAAAMKAAGERRFPAGEGRLPSRQTQRSGLARLHALMLMTSLQCPL